ncbi:uncharacterized protein LOC120171916 [Hibiscus syriacus]|uniref:uncharacterized protein LOC120171916 n=1 Tax=Hibiscus syriacus TaxID=106335 RepID=UPI0019246A20|nr:uncharacterized protein LOC120171916 [Hibiscus syriacus]
MLELLKEHDCEIEYHLGKANVVVDALSHKVISDLRDVFASLNLVNDGSLIVELQVKPTFPEEIKVEQGSSSEYTLDHDGILCFHNRYCIRKDDELRWAILQEAHSSHHAMHLSEIKMYKNLKEHYFWTVMKNISDFVARCLTC